MFVDGTFFTHTLLCVFHMTLTFRFEQSRATKLPRIVVGLCHPRRTETCSTLFQVYHTAEFDWKQDDILQESNPLLICIRLLLADEAGREPPCQ